jgi:hypothetical protein
VEVSASASRRNDVGQVGRDWRGQDPVPHNSDTCLAEDVRSLHKRPSLLENLVSYKDNNSESHNPVKYLNDANARA